MNEDNWMPMDVDGHGKEGRWVDRGKDSESAYRGLDPNISEQYVMTQFYAGMEKLESYLAKQAAFLDYMEG